MTIEQIKTVLKDAKTISFQLPNGDLVPAHFHVTEVGRVEKKFIDCGGTMRHEVIANFQLWSSDDYDHRLHPEKLSSIIELSQKKLGIEDLNIEVEYQGQTIGKYGLEYDGASFLLTTKMTDCLAKDGCMVPDDKMKVDLSSMIPGNSCDPNGGCC
jgi:hypothetical protein